MSSSSLQKISRTVEYIRRSPDIPYSGGRHSSPIVTLDSSFGIDFFNTGVLLTLRYCNMMPEAIVAIPLTDCFRRALVSQPGPVYYPPVGVCITRHPAATAVQHP